ncbi:hypothetical protein O9Z70_13125 [Devosia sp. YIM 151766]|uniref:hypothetical protein n=1 Tax=Devosia sp. YIM 151766 TaxID=3017325 RepID=UPI00255C9C86|nr:hypothetical protein [Devosia sp. YIM 151766]WIY52395.1 hypothetical protein O9Z70_13125 [Devosia sp. YIM 151766]
MPSYKITLQSGQSFIVDDSRGIEKISEELCTDGFVIVKRRGSAYSSQTTQISILERAVVSIEPAD